MLKAPTGESCSRQIYTTDPHIKINWSLLQTPFNVHEDNCNSSIILAVYSLYTAATYCTIWQTHQQSCITIVGYKLTGETVLCGQRVGVNGNPGDPYLLQRSVCRPCGGPLHLVQHIHPINDMPKNCVLACKSSTLMHRYEMCSETTSLQLL